MVRSWWCALPLLLAGCPTTPAGTPDAAGGDPCVACVTDSDCSGGKRCTQSGGETYCLLPCDDGTCAVDSECLALSGYDGEPRSACAPIGTACSPAPDEEPADAGIPPDQQCGTLVGPDVDAPCHACTSNCQANGCYGGWWCDTSSSRCRAPPLSCDAPADAGTVDAGTPLPDPVGEVGANGGTVDNLVFAAVGDTRPPTTNDTAGYPTATIRAIYTAIAESHPRPSFVVSSGDYVFASATSDEAAAQFAIYKEARALFPGPLFAAMGNHECNGYTVSNCGAGNAQGITKPYTAFMDALVTPLGRTKPYYSVDVNAADASWTAKFVLIAANAWDAAQADWLETELSRPTTYTFVMRHEPAAADTAPGTIPSGEILARHPYTLLIVGHTHTYFHSPGSREVLVGNGGAPLTGQRGFGWGRFVRRADGNIVGDMVKLETGTTDRYFHFVVKPDGSAAQ